MSVNEVKISYKKILENVRRVSIFKSVIEDPAVKLAVQLIGRIDGADPHIEPTYAELFAILAENAEMSSQPIIGNAWQNYLLDAILEDDNVFARKSEYCSIDKMGKSLIEQTKNDLAALKCLFDIKLDTLDNNFSPLDSFEPMDSAKADKARQKIKQFLSRQQTWDNCLDGLAKFYSAYGAGSFGRFRAFRWKNGRLLGVESPDPIALTDLIEYDWQRDSIKRNTLKMLNGFSTNNMLLYGDRGTGKSSCVKAMLNEFVDTKLRLVEIPKENLIELPDVLAILRKRPEKFILFIDDLSFEENETQYKALKAILEGGLEARPENVALYATSNRRNLIRERFSDRTKDSDDVHPGDTKQEKLSLADRFGLKIPFLAPDKEEYLRIVKTLAERAGIEFDEETKKKALTWQSARSGRCARQFVDYWIGEKALENQ